MLSLPEPEPLIAAVNGSLCLIRDPRALYSALVAAGSWGTTRTRKNTASSSFLLSSLPLASPVGGVGAALAEPSQA